jgi:hypothetical protein
MMAVHVWKVYFVSVRVFFSLVFAVCLYFLPELVFREGYQEHYYTSLNIGFTFRDYLMRYPTELYFPAVLLFAFPGMLFKDKIGWIGALALLLVTGLLNLPGRTDWGASFFPGLIFFACCMGLVIQLRQEFRVTWIDVLLGFGLAGLYGVLRIVEYNGGFLNKDLPEL